jgi:hypothetical protein
MTDKINAPAEKEQPKRFTSYEEFLKECYPKSAERTTNHNLGERENEDFGGDLAIDSLTRHSSILRFDGE